MTTSVLLAVGQALVLVGALAAVHVPLGSYLARTLTSPHHTRAERVVYRAVRVDADAEMRWTAYLRGILALTLVSIVAVMLLARTQDLLPLAGDVPAMAPHTAWNTAVSFATNTNWQSYAGETAATPVLRPPTSSRPSAPSSNASAAPSTPSSARTSPTQSSTSPRASTRR